MDKGTYKATCGTIFYDILYCAIKWQNVFGLSRLGMLTEAERFFDVSDLILSAATPSGPVTI